MQNGSLTHDEVEASWRQRIDPENEQGDKDGDMCDEEESAFFWNAVNQQCSSDDSEEEDGGSEEEDEDGDSEKNVDSEYDNGPVGEDEEKDEAGKLKPEVADLETKPRTKFA